MTGVGAARRPGSDADGDEALAQLMRECVTSGIERRVLRLRLSLVSAGWAKPGHRLVKQAIEPLTGADRARHFALADGDLVVVWRGAADSALQQVLRIFHTLFDDLPQPNAELAQVLVLPRDAALLARPDQECAPDGAQLLALPPIDPAMLGAIERVLAQANLARFVRRRPVCRVLFDERLGFAWEKRFLSIAELAATLAPGHDLRADPWLFGRLTRTLDRRMLALLSAPGELAGARPFALNLNVGSILSPEFLRFDAGLPAVLRGQVQLDLLAADVVSDLHAFAFARDFARARGYRLSLRDVAPKLMPALAATWIGLDFIGLRWSAGYAEAGVNVPERDRVILGHADSRNALRWGRAQGITLFQGRAAVPGTA